jgi:hypothetical protein
MPYISYNVNPKHNRSVDCVVRAIAVATDTDWDTAYIALSVHGFMMKDVINSDPVWWDFLSEHGFEYHAIANVCPKCVSVRDFCEKHPNGVFVIATQNHVLAAVDGSWIDTWDSGDEIVLNYWTKEI